MNAVTASSSASVAAVPILRTRAKTQIKLLSLVMPAYNESTRIERNVLLTAATLAEAGFDYEIIVVDDGSTDATYAQALKASHRHPERIRVLRYERNQGKGSALVYGTARAYGAYVAFLDADLDLHPSHISALFRALIETGSDIVIGSKLHPQSRIQGYPLVRRLYSRTYYAMTHMLFGLPVKDTQTGVKIFRAAALKTIFPLVTVRGFAFDLEVLALAHMLGFRIIEAPVKLDFQRVVGRIVLRDAIAVALDTLRLCRRLRSRRVKAGTSRNRTDRNPIVLVKALGGEA